MKCDFSLKHYRKILKEALKRGFVITNFENYKRVPKSLILRHDIDALPERALALAKIEQSLEVKAIYFIRVHGQYYYPEDKKTFKALKTILKMGHKIGLHTEARSLSKVFQMDPVDLFNSEKKFLEELLGIKVNSASEHGDLGRKENFYKNDFLKNPKLKIKFYPQLFCDHQYFSDSLMSWKKGCLCQNLERYDMIQLLTHGEWWGKGAKVEMTKLNKTYAKI